MELQFLNVTANKIQAKMPDSFRKKNGKNNDLDELYVEIITLQKCFDLSPAAGQHCAVLIMTTIL